MFAFDVGEIVFLISFLDRALLVHSNSGVFCMLILYPTGFTKLLHLRECFCIWLFWVLILFNPVQERNPAICDKTHGPRGHHAERDNREVLWSLWYESNSGRDWCQPQLCSRGGVEEVSVKGTIFPAVRRASSGDLSSMLRSYRHFVTHRDLKERTFFTFYPEKWASLSG